MNSGFAMQLARDLMLTTMAVAGPLLLVALVAGVVVGLFQTITQINEASLSFLIKAVALALTIVLLGSTLASHLLAYGRRCFTAIEHLES